MPELEIEVTYLLDYLPQDLFKQPHTDILDKYIHGSSTTKLRLRKKDDHYELTKKSQPDKDDASIQQEQTIDLSEEEFNIINQLPGLELHKTRYYYEYEELKLEIDIFHDALQGLATAECEFPTEREKNTFIKPDFCLIDITQEKYIAGSQLAGKSYKDIEEILNTFGYKKIEK